MIACHPFIIAMDEHKLERKNVVRPTEQLTWVSDVLLRGDR